MVNVEGDYYILDIYCQQLWNVVQLGGVCVPFGHRVGEWTFSKICICIGYILPTIVECCSFGGCLCALRAQGWKIILYLFRPTFIFLYIVSNWLRCQIDSGVKLTPLHSWCQIGPVSNWLRCQIGTGVKLVPVSNCPPIFTCLVSDYLIFCDPRTIWHRRQFDTMGKNGQFDTADNLTPWNVCTRYIFLYQN